MKTTIAILFTMLSIVCNAQTKYHVYMIQIGRWSEYSKDWNYDKGQSVSMDIITSGSNIYVTDAVRSVYEIISDKGDYNSKTQDGVSFRSHSWSCLDEKNRKVIFKIAKYENDSDTIFTVMYDDILFRYYVAPKNNELDRLN
mgnify:CR=1 FL=1